MPELPEVCPVVSFHDHLGQVAGMLGLRKAGHMKFYYWVETTNRKNRHARTT